MLKNSKATNALGMEIGLAQLGAKLQIAIEGNIVRFS